MKKAMASVSLLFSVLCGFPLAAQAGPPPPPAFQLSNVVGSAIDFGPVSVGASAQTVVGGTNYTPYVLSIYAALGGPDAGDFSVINNCSGIPIVPGARCSGIIGFTPRSAGPKTAELLIVMHGTLEAVQQFGTAEQTPAIDYGTGQYLYLETRTLSGLGK